MRKTPYRTTLLILLLAVVCLGVVWQEVATSQSPEPDAASLVAYPLDPAPLAATLSDAADAVRHGMAAGSTPGQRAAGCAFALTRAAEEAAAAPSPGVASFFTVVEGLYAHACEDVERAAERLAAAAPAPAAPAGAIPLEDWRLLALADSAAATGEPRVARQALDRLLADHPASPLRPEAFLEAVRLSHANGDPAAAVVFLLRARAEGIGTAPGGAGREEGLALEELAWQIAEERGNPDARRTLQQAAARQLLTYYPERADELTATAVFRRPGADPEAPLDWAAVLTVDELATRARHLLAANRPLDATRALTAVPLERRDFDWRLLAAEALTDQGDGVAALALLAEPGALTEADIARLELQRALAAFDAARVRRGRPPLPSDERDRLRREARAHLVAAARPGAEPREATRALRRLFAELWDDARTEESIRVLAHLRQIEPQDFTGTRPLWQAGWNQFMARNYSGAIGYWSELLALYPDSAYSRNGRYWTARAHDELGNRERAEQIFREVVATETGDFYTRFAQARLGGVTAVSAAAPLAQERGIPWPTHPLLTRARLLSDLGLEELAHTELAAVGGKDVRADGRAGGRDDPATPELRRAALALEALVLSRQGQPRASIGRIHDAFPALGGPLQATVPQEALRLYYPIAHADVVRQQARSRALSPYLVLGMIRQESAFDADALSHAGARGLMQLMPATSREVAGKLGLPWSTSRLNDPAFNVTLGTTYFRQVLGMFEGDVELALAGYNGGPYRIKRLVRESSGVGRDVFVEGLPVPESRLYVKRILQHSDAYRQLHPEAGG